MHKIKRIKSISELKELWTVSVRWQKQTFYQGYVWNEFLHDRVKHSLSGRLGFRYICYYVVYRGNEPIIIAPLEVSRTSRKVRIASGQVAGVLDFVFADSYSLDDERPIEELINRLRKDFNGYNLVMFDIPKKSPLARYFLKRSLQYPLIERGSYHVPIESFNDYNMYFASLSKHARQNARTSFNRLKKDGRSYKLLHYSGCNAIQYTLLSHLWLIYLNRSLHWKGRKSSIFNQCFIRLKCAWDLLTKNVLKSLQIIDVSNIFIFVIDEVPAAFCITYLDNQRILVPKLAYDSGYSRYSPGILLCLEVVKWCKSHGIDDFDLCRGDEPYKTVVGGVNTPLIKLSFKISHNKQHEIVSK